MVVASCRITLHIPESFSLKDKRQVVQSLLRKLRDRHNVSAVEDGGRDLWGKAVIGLALAARDRQDAEARLGRIQKDAEELTGLKYVDFETTYHG